MVELPKQLLAWLARLLPKQEVRGARAVQAGRVDGDLNTDHSTTQLFRGDYVGSGAVHMGHVSGSVHNITQVQADGGMQLGQVGGNVTIVHFHAPATRGPAPVPGSASSGGANAEQREVLSMIRRLPNSAAVFDFMERSFDTRMVIELQPAQLVRVRRYVETINNRRRMRA